MIHVTITNKEERMDEYLSPSEAAGIARWWQYDLAVKDKIVYLLAGGRWVCGSIFMSLYIPTYSQRIGEMINEGMEIERSTCTEHKHRGGIGAYRSPNATQLF